MALEIDLLDLDGQAITASCHQFDVRLAVRTLTERLSQRIHVLRKIGVFNERLRPERFHQLALAHDPVMVLGEQEKQIEGFWRESNRTARSLQPAQCDVDPVRPKFV